jgi:hypothetical protein
VKLGLVTSYNETWDLYRNYDGGHFCCEQGQYGFNRTQGGVGCGTEQELMIESRTSLSPVSLGKIQVLLKLDTALSPIKPVLTLLTTEMSAIVVSIKIPGFVGAVCQELMIESRTSLSPVSLGKIQVLLKLDMRPVLI